jgi:hypothetical protein
MYDKARPYCLRCKQAKRTCEGDALPGSDKPKARDELVFDQFIDDLKTVVDLAEFLDINHTSVPARPDARQGAVKLTKIKRTKNLAGEEHPSSHSLGSEQPSKNSGPAFSHHIHATQSSATPAVSINARTSPSTLSLSDTLSWSSATSFKSAEPVPNQMPPPENLARIAPKLPIALKPAFSLSLGLVTPL